ncbi:MAG: hypothetical protein ACE5IL_14465 [Myxococcota bacterium]
MAKATGLGLVLAALFSAAPALAEEAHAAHGPSAFLLALQALNALLLVGLLLRFVRRPLQEFMVQRRHRIEAEIRAARQRIDEAEADLAQWRSQLETFESESERLVAEAEALGRREREQASRRAEQNARRIAEDARRVADQEIERSRLALRLEAASLAAEIARDLVQRYLAPDDDRRLVAESIERMSGPAG